jgi:hypothetical protein
VPQLTIHSHEHGACRRIHSISARGIGTVPRGLQSIVRREFRTFLRRQPVRRQFKPVLWGQFGAVRRWQLEPVRRRQLESLIRRQRERIFLSERHLESFIRRQRERIFLSERQLESFIRRQRERKRELV